MSVLMLPLTTVTLMLHVPTLLGASPVHVTIDIRGFTGLETPNELHNRGALTDAHAHAGLIILMAVKGDQYSLLSRQLK